MSRISVMFHDREEDGFAIDRKDQLGVPYCVLRLGGDLSVFLSPSRLRELSAAIQAALPAEEPQLMRKTTEPSEAAELFQQGRKILAEIEVKA